MPPRRGRPPVPDDQKVKRAAAMLAEDLVDMLVEVAAHRKTSVAELVEESPLRVWVKEQKLRVLTEQMAEAKRLTKELAEHNAKKKP